MKITITKIDKNPLDWIGKVAGTCWGADTSDTEKNIKRAKECMSSGHDRTLEFTTIDLEIEDISIRAGRELYTHVVGTSKLQSSTRYINEQNFTFYTPSKIKNNHEQHQIFIDCMQNIQTTYKKLVESGIPKEDAANVLPLGAHSKIVLRINLRSLINMCNQRMCMRAYAEMREFIRLLKKELEQVSSEWKWICDEYLQPKCFRNGICHEKYSCGLKPKKLM